MRIGLVEFLLILAIASLTVGPRVALFVDRWMRRANRANAMAMNAVAANGVNASAKNYETERKTTFDFSISLEQGKITNQKKSGRCWMFSTLNVLRQRVIAKCDLEDFSFSPTYLAFYDKL